MNHDSTALGFLGRALSLEFSAIQHYIALAKWLEMQGMAPFAQQFSEQSNAQLKQVERIIGRMLALGVAPNASRCRPVHLQGTLPEKMKQALAHERELSEFYTLAVTYCQRTDDHENKFFFDLVLKEKQQRVVALEQWLSTLFGDAKILKTQ